MKNKYQITIIGSGLLSAELALFYAKQNISVCLLSENDFGDIGGGNKLNVISEISDKEAGLMYKSAANNYIPIELINIKTNTNSVSKFITQLLSKSRINSDKYKANNELSFIEPQLKQSEINYATLKKTYKYDYARVSIDTLITAHNYNADIFNYVKNIVLNKEGNSFNIKLKNNKIEFITDLVIDVRKKHNTKKYNYLVLPRFKLELENSVQIYFEDFPILITPFYSTIIIRANANICNNQILEIINTTFSKTIIEKEILESWIEFDDDCKPEFKENIAIVVESNKANNLREHKQLLEWINTKLNINKNVNLTTNLHNNFTTNLNKSVIFEEVQNVFRQVQQSGIEPLEFTKLFYRYGSKFEVIIDKAYDFYNDRELRPIAWLLAEIWYSKTYEFAITKEDFIYRRASTHLAKYFDKSVTETIDKYFDIIV